MCHRIFLALMTVMLVGSVSASMSRIQHVRYKPDHVVDLVATSLVATQIRLAPSEQIESVHCGDSAAWMIQRDINQPNSIYVKPTMIGSNTNLTVSTDRHNYYFHLVSKANTQLFQVAQPYAIDFTYPAKRLRPHLTHLSKHTHYTYSGDPAIRPRRIYDDGRFVYLSFGSGQSLPAVFAVSNEQGQESLVNWRVSHQTIKLDRLAPQYNLRLGHLHVGCVFNADWVRRIRNKNDDE